LVAGPTGLEDLARIIDTARDVLMPGGWLILEHGWDQGPAVRELLSAASYRAVSSHQDFAGHDRVALGRHEPEQEDPA
jgi:release factor glutamine methyltransferase